MSKITLTLDIDDIDVARQVLDLVYGDKPQQAEPVPVPQAQPAPAPAPAVPTAQPKQYTLDELTKACAPIMDAGKRQDLIDLLKEFGVDAMPQLPKEQYGEFATKLRALGAQI